MAPLYSLGPATTRIDLTVNAGDLFDLLVPILDDNDDPVTIADGDETLWAARATVRRNALSAEFLWEFVTNLDPTPNAFIVPGTPAQVRLVAKPVETAAWQDDWPSFHVGWDLDVTEPAQGPTDPDHGPTPNRVASGRFQLIPQYAR